MPLSSPLEVVDVRLPDSPVTQSTLEQNRRRERFNRGSVRVTTGHVMTAEKYEQRKQRDLAETLP